MSGRLVPLREALGPLEPHAQHLAHQRLVALLVAEADETRGELGVEHVGDLGVPGPAQDRDVLAAGVDHDLDVGVGEHARERLRVRRVVAERVDHLGAHAVGRVGVGHRHLGQAQQRLVAALGHELGVDRHAPVGGGALCQRRGHSPPPYSGRCPFSPPLLRPRRR